MSGLTLEFIDDLLAPDPEFVFIPEKIIDVTCPLCWRVRGYECLTISPEFHAERVKEFNARRNP